MHYLSNPQQCVVLRQLLHLLSTTVFTGWAAHGAGDSREDAAGGGCRDSGEFAVGGYSGAFARDPQHHRRPQGAEVCLFRLCALENAAHNKENIRSDVIK